MQGASFLKCRLFYTASYFQEHRIAFSPYHSVVFFNIYITCHCFKMFIFLCGHVRLLFCFVFPPCDNMLPYFVVLRTLDVFYVFNKTLKHMKICLEEDEDIGMGGVCQILRPQDGKNNLCIVSTNE